MNSMAVSFQFLWSKLQEALTAFSVFGFGAFGQRYNLMVGKHSGLVCQLSAGGAERLTARVTVEHHHRVLQNTHIHTNT